MDLIKTCLELQSVIEAQAELIQAQAALIKTMTLDLAHEANTNKMMGSE